MACETAAIPMTLRVTFKVIQLLYAFSTVFSYSCAAVDKFSADIASHAVPLAIAELLVLIGIVLIYCVFGTVGLTPYVYFGYFQFFHSCLLLRGLCTTVFAGGLRYSEPSFVPPSKIVDTPL